MTAEMTFAEAYQLRKSQERSDNQRRKDVVSSYVSSIEELGQVLEKIKHHIEKGKPLRSIRQIFKSIPFSFLKQVSGWRDTDNLDLLHHSIVHNRSDLVAFCIVETNMFPASHAPPINPYAHLAAVLGHAECLRTILQHRPGYFFTSTKPQHAIRLPAHIRRLMKGEDPLRPSAKHKVLDKIKTSAFAAEQKMKDDDMSSIATDMAGLLDADLDRSFQKPRLVKQKHIMALKPKKETRKVVSEPTSIGVAGGGTRRERASGMFKSTGLTVHSIDHCRVSLTPPNPDRLRSSFILGAKPPRSMSEASSGSKDSVRLQAKHGRKHVITVYWNNLFTDPGVVRGAGQPAQVIYSDHHPEPLDPLDSSIDPVPKRSLKSWSAVTQRTEPSSSKKISSANASESISALSKMAEKKATKRIDIGVRGMKKMKEFKLKTNKADMAPKDDTASWMNKTPLTLAAEKGHVECVQIIFTQIISKRFPKMSTSEPLTLATRAKSPEAIMLLLDKVYTRDDYQGAVLLAIREMYPVCLTALLGSAKNRNWLFDGTNLFHILYSQCVITNHRYEMMPEMTRALIACREDVNAHNMPRTFPMYTLINCAFNISTGKQIFFFVDCLHILLEHKANPHFDEEDQAAKGSTKTEFSFSRALFSSAIKCVFDSAKNSLRFFEKPYWSKLFMKKFITTIEAFDRTTRRVLHTPLFDYMSAVCELGLDRTIVHCLLRYGTTPDYMIGNKYVVNVYFDNILPYMTRFEIADPYSRYIQELDTLMIVCRAMDPRHLLEAMRIFLKDHLLGAPIQALPITRQFAALLDRMVRNPRPLVELAARSIWLRVKRNKHRLRTLRVPEEFVHLVLP